MTSFVYLKSGGQENTILNGMSKMYGSLSNFSLVGPGAFSEVALIQVGLLVEKDIYSEGSLVVFLLFY